MLKSHYALYSQNLAAFGKRNISKKGKACSNKDGSQLYPGCLNSPDVSDNSFINLLFPVGQASLPHGKYADGILSVSLTKFDANWVPEVDFGSSHQNFVLLLLRMHEKY